MALSTHYTDFFFFNDTATTEIYTLSLHDALPISGGDRHPQSRGGLGVRDVCGSGAVTPARSEEHTSELQSQSNLVCRLLLEKKKHPSTQRSIRSSTRRMQSYHASITPISTGAPTP